MRDSRERKRAQQRKAPRLTENTEVHKEEFKLAHNRKIQILDTNISSAYNAAPFGSAQVLYDEFVAAEWFELEVRYLTPLTRRPILLAGKSED